ncbi:MAG: hypothetical protein ACU0DW_06615, partial [Shimia sp.]
WIIEGGLSATYDTRLARSDMLIWLDTPLAIRLWRITRRFVQHYGVNRPDLPEGCPERLGWRTFEFYWFILRTARRNWRANQQRFQAYEGRKVRLTSIVDTNRWVATLT